MEELLSFIFGSVEPYFWNVLSSLCVCSSLAFSSTQIRVVQRKQLGVHLLFFFGEEKLFSTDDGKDCVLDFELIARRSILLDCFEFRLFWKASAEI